MLVEAAWSYRHRPAIGINLRRRSEGQPPEVIAYAWAAQCRLYSRFHSIAASKNRNVAVVAVARELSGFIWGLMTDNIETALPMREGEQAHLPEGSSRTLCEFRSARVVRGSLRANP